MRTMRTMAVEKDGSDEEGGRKVEGDVGRCGPVNWGHWGSGRSHRCPEMSPPDRPFSLCRLCGGSQPSGESETPCGTKLLPAFRQREGSLALRQLLTKLRRGPTISMRFFRHHDAAPKFKGDLDFQPVFSFVTARVQGGDVKMKRSYDRLSSLR